MTDQPTITVTAHEVEEAVGMSVSSDINVEHDYQPADGSGPCLALHSSVQDAMRFIVRLHTNRLWAERSATGRLYDYTAHYGAEMVFADIVNHPAVTWLTTRPGQEITVCWPTIRVDG